MVKVKFLKNYTASRGPGIAGAQGVEKEYRMSDALKDLIEQGIVEVVKSTPAARRKKATKKKAEKS